MADAYYVIQGSISACDPDDLPRILGLRDAREATADEIAVHLGAATAQATPAPDESVTEAPSEEVQPEPEAEN